MCLFCGLTLPVCFSPAAAAAAAAATADVRDQAEKPVMTEILDLKDPRYVC